jgi:ArsR family transcriptional regulator, arsenate/arsenite/antimonite-responsive transcriptional repressor
MSMADSLMDVNTGGTMTARSIATIDSRVVACCSPVTAGALSEVEAREVSSVFAALGDPVRLRLLSLIAASNEACSCNLEIPLGKSQPTISHHTRILAEAGLIVGEKRGRWTYWRTVPERLALAARLLGPA